jgi:phosphoenolpyruvate carboxykinase (GTP)
MPGRTTAEKLPKVFFVNWFRKRDGKFLWPGFGDNIRVLQWIVDRLEGKVSARPTEIGLLPEIADLDVSGLDLSAEALADLLTVDQAIWTEEAALVQPHYERFGTRMPSPLWHEYALLKERLAGAAFGQEPSRQAVSSQVAAE